MLKDIQSPADLKRLSVRDLRPLSDELRQEIVESVAQNGGHLSSNLGAVELTLALHYVFDCPDDKLVFDTGHQAYAHKLLTGRLERFRTGLRKEGGLSGFPRPVESEYDSFTAGHASTAISAALGMARTRDVMGDKSHVVAIVGDGALTGGLCYEALNDAGQAKTRLIVVLNDNAMSIAKNVGAMSGYLTGLRQSKGYRSFKRVVRRGLEGIPKIGMPMFRFVGKLRDFLKAPFVDGKFFGALGFEYVGPVDGHDLKTLIRVLRRAKDEEGPLLVHVATVKGKGYLPAEDRPDEYHGVAPFFVETGEPRAESSAISCGQVAAAELVALAENDIRISAVAAAMPGGTGMSVFADAHPERFFDVGIAEEHGVEMAAGMAASGMKPYVAIYSTFLQRAFDQIATDICINALPVTFLVDRAGLVGADGATHHGVYDLGYLSMLPNMVVAAPRDARDLKRLIRLSAGHDGPMAIRYPKDGEDMGARMEARPFDIGEWELLNDGADAMFLAVGRMVQVAMLSAIELAGRGISAGVIDARFVKPMDEKLLRRAMGAKLVVTLEENVLSGGFGERVLRWVSENEIDARVMVLGVPDRHIECAGVESQLACCGIDSVSVARKVLERLGR